MTAANSPAAPPAGRPAESGRQGAVAGAMVGLFWVDRDGCWLGAPPGGEGAAVRLTDAGLEVTGASAAVQNWPQVERVALPDASARSAFRRGLSTAIGLATTMAGFGGPEAAPLMTVCVTHAEGTSEHLVSSAAAPAYTEREVELSHRLLERFVAGELNPSLLGDWWRSAGHPASPRPAARETLLEQWCGR
ncbi:hypothetical protein AB0C96_21685 [Streptomyces sp. NPDC048506]|uniref:hypothetical protein n=1 Tax=Streptomyces sp. NPDC048506 TaxID=3155028 RepID=UPI00343E958E